MLAVHLDNLLFILLMAGIGLLRLLAKKAGGTSEPQDQPPPPSPGMSDQTDEERIRKFLEALGQPASSRPPAPVRPRPAGPIEKELPRQQVEEAERAARRRRLLNPLPPLTTVPPPLPRRVITPRTPTPPVAEPLPVAPPQAAVVLAYEVNVSGASETQPPPLPATLKPVEAYTVAKAGPAAALAKLFASRDDLRRAIILREVFGPPRGLQPLDSIGS